MPAKKRGKGFTRKKKKSPSPAASGGASKKTGKPPKTPKVAKKADSATSSKRKEKEVSTLSVPRRYSPRLLAIRTRKMSMENGSLIPTSTLVTLDQTIQVVEDVGDHLDYHEADGADNHGNHRAGSNNTKQTFKKRGKQQQLQQEEEEEEEPEPEQEQEQADGEELDIDVFDDDEEQEEQEPPKIMVDPKDLEDENNINHGVYMYFWKTAGVPIHPVNVKGWIYANLGDKKTIGSIRYCSDLKRGFYFIFFEREEAREKALAFRSEETGLQVTVFPWSCLVNERGEKCNLRMVVVPGLSSQLFQFLPTIGNSLGTYIGGIGALDPDADVEAVRSQGGWDSMFHPTAACEAGKPRIAVLVPCKKRLPRFVEFHVKKGVTKQEIREDVFETKLQQRATPAKRASVPRQAGAKKLKA